VTFVVILKASPGIRAHHGCGDPLVVICTASLPRRREIVAVFVQHSH
jgi:hypothetical protein